MSSTLEFPDDWDTRIKHSTRLRERFYHKVAGFSKAEARKLAAEGITGFQGPAPSPAHQQRMQTLIEAYGRYAQRRNVRDYLDKLPTEGLKPS